MHGLREFKARHREQVEAERVFFGQASHWETESRGELDSRRGMGHGRGTGIGWRGAFGFRMGPLGQEVPKQPGCFGTGGPATLPDSLPRAPRLTTPSISRHDSHKPLATRERVLVPEFRSFVSP